MMRCDRSDPADCRHYAGILVLAPPVALEDCCRHLEQLVEVHRAEAQTGRIIVVLETASLEEQESLLERVRKSPHVLLAELVYYRTDSELREDAALFNRDHEIGRAEA
jgi:nitrate reductase NapAB chaperone NapD